MLRSLSVSLVLSFAAAACGGLASGAAGGADAGHAVDGGGGADAPGDAKAAPRDALAEAGVTCAISHRVVTTKSSPTQFLTDAAHLYWFDNAYGPAEVYVTDKCTAGPVKRLARLPKAANELAQDATHLYVAAFSSDTTTTDAGVYSVSKADGAVQKLVDAPKGADGVAVQGGWVYWTEEATNRVGRVAAGGGSPDYINFPFTVLEPSRIAVLPDGTACVVGDRVQCLLPSSALVTVPVPGSGADTQFLSNDDHAIYVVSRDAASTWTVLRATPSASPSVETVIANPGDAGSAALSGVVALAGGVYVASGTGTVTWVPNGGGAATEKTIGSTLPPFRFFADVDGVYWDVGEGVEVGPGIAP